MFQTFHAGSLVHLACIAVLVIVVTTVCRAGRRAIATGPDSVTRFDRRFATVLAFIWIVCQIQDLLPGHFRWDRSLPLHVCDLAGIAAPIAIASGRKIARAMLYFWGLGLSTQAFITPVLFRGPGTADFWTYWLCHFAIVVPAVYDLIVKNYRPDWADWRRMVIVGALYTTVVMPVNMRLRVNYGYLGQSDFAQTTLIQYLGPWPGRVPVLLLIVWGGSALMTLPWVFRRSKQFPVSPNFRLPIQPPASMAKAA